MIDTELIPVIHMVKQEQVIQNVETCVEAGIKKVFLINHVVTEREVLDTARYVLSMYDLWVGVNLLGRPARSAIQIPLIFDGLWCDESIREEDVPGRLYKGLLFAGLAFKYQPQPSDLKKACEAAKRTCDVATTSGPATGRAASREKIESIREYLGYHPMAVASGVSVDNLEIYKGLVNYLLVASSITDHDEMIIPDKLKELRGLLD